MKTSIISNLTDKELQELLDTSCSAVEILDKLGFSKYSGNHRTLKKRLMESDLDMTTFNDNKKEWRKNFMGRLAVRNPIEEIFRENNSKSSSQIKRVVIREKLIE